MYFKQFYLGCLAHASYMIGCAGEAAVVDPQRDVDIYLEESRLHGLKIRHVIETHLHADFVSGHRELAGRTGAKVYLGAKAGARFDHVPVHEGEEIRIGEVVLRFLETPGHTPESISVLVFDLEVSAELQAVLTGDTLFIGDVGRPDLLGAKMSAAELAGQLYDSLHLKLLSLPDEVKVYPAHGAGSLCGRNISSERSSTIGRERRFNCALKAQSREEFIGMLTTDLPEAPSYFHVDVEINRTGPSMLTQLPEPLPLVPAEVVRRMNLGCTVLDIRPSADYGAGHLPGALNIGLDGQFASWAGTLISATTPIVLVAGGEDAVREARIRLARVGLENVIGYLADGMPAWGEDNVLLVKTEQINVEELAARLKGEQPPRVLDVRRPGEWQAGHIAGALHLPLHTLINACGCLRREPVAVVCAGGYRSSMAAGILERNGFPSIANVVGGMTAWASANLPIAR